MVVGGSPGMCVAGLSHSPTPGKGFGRDGPGARALFYSHRVFRAFQESPGEPCSHLQAQGCRLFWLRGREGKKEKAHPFLGGLLWIWTREKRDRVCGGGRRLGSSPRQMFQERGSEDLGAGGDGGAGSRSHPRAWGRVWCLLSVVLPQPGS